MSADDDVFEAAQRWLESGRKVALATVVETWGSAPRPAGSTMAICDDGAFVGSISGGCVEGAVIEAADETLRSGSARELRFGISDENAWSVGLACGGRIRVYVEAIE
jgi:xanthine/CO dehydrogenase XdhC/CoxF family maturation factor